MYIYIYIYIHIYTYISCYYWYGVATISRMLENIGLFCKRDLQKRPIFCKETYIFKHPTHRSHPIATCPHRETHELQYDSSHTQRLVCVCVCVCVCLCIYIHIHTYIHIYTTYLYIHVYTYTPRVSSVSLLRDAQFALCFESYSADDAVPGRVYILTHIYTYIHA